MPFLHFEPKEFCIDILFYKFQRYSSIECFDVVNLWYKIKACKLPSMKGKFNKKLERNKRKLFTSPFTIAIPIINFTNVVKEVEI
jgi:hypothetical protein